MGGYGSGRTAWKHAYTVEDCHTLSLRTIAHDVKRGYGAGNVWWTNWRGDKTAEIGYAVVAGGVRLFYATTDRWDRRTEYDYVIPTTTTTLHGGGRDWFFRCPRCGYRARKMYLPPGGGRFACRKCHNLTYTSCRESHKWDSLYKTMAAGLDMDWRVVGRLLRRRYR